VSSIWREHIMATQFHPEKSQKAGLKILANFAAL
jgi:glutamine amidotransferase